MEKVHDPIFILFFNWIFFSFWLLTVYEQLLAWLLYQSYCYTFKFATLNLIYFCEFDIEAAVSHVILKKPSKVISQNSQENANAGDSFWQSCWPTVSNIIKEEALEQVLSYPLNFAKIFKSSHRMFYKKRCS